MKFTPHSEKQDQAFWSDARITLLVTGIQFGKTTTGAWWLLRQCLRDSNPEYNYLVTAPTYKIMEQSTLPAFLRVFDNMGEYNGQKATCKLFAGGTIYFRTGTDPESPVGITKVKAIWCDEAGKYSKYFWDNIKARSSFLQCPTFLTTTPYSFNWVYTDIYKPWAAGKTPDVTIIQAKSWENRHFPKEEFEKRKAEMDPRRFKMIYEGEFGKMEGLVYDCFDEDENVIEPFDLPTGTVYYGGIDWGYTDPFVCLIHAITPSGGHYQVSEFKRSSMTLSDIAILLEHKSRIFKTKQYYCDPSQPGHIAELNRLGVPCSPAINDIKTGIDIVYELIKSRKLKFFKDRCQNTMDEMSTYHYPEPKDLTPDESAKDIKPVGQNDHAMDALRYVVRHTHRSNLRHTPIVIHEGPKPQEHHSEKIERLKRLPQHSKTENWS